MGERGKKKRERENPSDVDWLYHFCCLFITQENDISR